MGKLQKYNSGKVCERSNLLLFFNNRANRSPNRCLCGERLQLFLQPQPFPLQLRQILRKETLVRQRLL